MSESRRIADELRTLDSVVGVCRFHDTITIDYELPEDRYAIPNDVWDFVEGKPRLTIDGFDSGSVTIEYHAPPAEMATR